jgi:hypothetical protein
MTKVLIKDANTGRVLVLGLDNMMQAARYARDNGLITTARASDSVRFEAYAE